MARLRQHPSEIPLAPPDRETLFAEEAVRTDGMTIATMEDKPVKDKLVDAQGSRDFHAHLQPAQAQFIEYPSLYHELFNETDADRVFGDLDHWLAGQRARIAA